MRRDENLSYSCHSCQKNSIFKFLDLHFVLHGTYVLIRIQTQRLKTLFKKTHLQKMSYPSYTFSDRTKNAVKVFTDKSNLK